MGDEPLQSGASAEPSRKDALAGKPSETSRAEPGRAAANHSSSAPPSQSHRRHSQTAGSPRAPQPQLEMTHQPRPPPFDMSAMANALPQQPYPPQSYGHGPPRYNAAAMMSPEVVPPMPSAHFGAPPTVGPVPAQQYHVPHHAHMSQYYPTPLSPQPLAALPPRADLAYYPSPFLVNQPPPPGAHYYYAPGATFPAHAHHMQGHFPAGQYGPPNAHQNPPETKPRESQPGRQAANPASVGQQETALSGSRQHVVRGPPRKPRQSGHAIWIGNLPPQTDLMSLVHHVCKEADGLESLFLISKSNCAFANFKDEQSCAAAQRKLHDSKFMTVRLVSRLRKSTVEGPAGLTAPTGPAASAPQAGNNTQEPSATKGAEANGNEATASTPATSTTDPNPTSPAANGGAPQKDRFFILKSLTIEDLELSVRTSTWATQSHNEETLNSAFKTSDNVYLVFSANKSGEYFGYARMASAINDDPAAAIEFAPSAQSASDVDLPKAIPTEATEFAPKGRIVDDSARGTIFWEADREEKGQDEGQDDDGSGGSVGGDTGSVRSGREGGGGEQPKAWGKPFRLEWLSTTRLPFYRTRGLRNPWNSNREVKIARDGTELEPSVGRRLIGLFNRAQSQAVGFMPGLVPQMAPAGPGGIRAPVPVPVPAGLAPMRSQC